MRIRFFSGRAFEVELLRHFEKLVFATLWLFGKANVFRSFLEQLLKRFAPFNEGSGAQVGSLKEEPVEGGVNEWGLLRVVCSLSM